MKMSMESATAKEKARRQEARIQEKDMKLREALEHLEMTFKL